MSKAAIELLTHKISDEQNALVRDRNAALECRRTAEAHEMSIKTREKNINDLKLALETLRTLT